MRFLIAVIFAMLDIVSMTPIIVLAFVLHGPEDKEESDEHCTCPSS